MSNPIPSSLALESIATDAEILSSNHRNNYAAIQTAINALVAALSGGTAGQLLTAADSTDVQWANVTATQKLAWVGMPSGETISLSVAWPTANAAILVPFTIQAAQTIASVNVRAGATQSGNFDVGVYDSSGNLKVSKGTTAQSTLTSSTINAVSVASTALSAGLYYLALASSNTTGTFAFDGPSGPFATYQRQVATSFPLPSTITVGSTAPTRALMMSAPLT